VQTNYQLTSQTEVCVCVCVCVQTNKQPTKQPTNSRRKVCTQPSSWRRKQRCVCAN